ncbi:hypothetical protein ERJ75_001448200 [Trypanosoma vivax]|uniref:Uncharacterized protein n=1 Tax=Trypanosoma vivax (strain Y486) TaxID=1055687 RepID=G0U826_TRYVY|nr:hypothetical protein TRVL_03619 [Trypanosoma vivax]KAH8607111.1 hypothetical protein ERJ75_001448200 [Trypanosoma vivax]CCC52035.1 conserved hypothetical protein [Trypanosoma vivax Y486]
MEGCDEVTATSFRVTVVEATPYCFQAYTTQQVQSSVRITHIAFTPPSAEEARARHHIAKQCSGKFAVGKEREGLEAAGDAVTLASLSALGASGKVERYTIACFPWCLPAGGVEAAASVGEKEAAASESRGKKRTKDGLHLAGPMQVQLGGIFDVTLPRQSDLCSNIDLRFDVDGSVQLEVVGPGSVTFFGEQYSALIPEWLNHQFFTVGDDDEEGEDCSDDEDHITEMYRLIH